MILSQLKQKNDDSESSEPGFGPQNEDTVYNEETEMRSFLPIPQCQQQEIEADQPNLSLSHPNKHNLANIK